MSSRAPEEEQFRREIEALRLHRSIAGLVNGDVVRLGELTTQQVSELIKGQGAGYYLLIAAAGLDRTAIKRALKSPDAQLVVSRLRRSHVIRDLLPLSGSFSSFADTAIALRVRDLQRRKAGTTEALFRQRLEAESIPVLMSPPIRSVPGILIGRRKPDGVYPDPASGQAPMVYLEVKQVRRVSDDIQKRLYEIAEVSLEMKLLYGSLNLRGLELSTTVGIAGSAHIRQQFREQIRASRPTVVALLLCAREEAERYRAGAEAFIDRIFFQEEIDECIAFLRAETAP